MKNKLLVALGVILSIFVGVMPTTISIATEVVKIYIISILIGFSMAIIFLLQFKINMGIHKQIEMEKSNRQNMMDKLIQTFLRTTTKIIPREEGQRICSNIIIFHGNKLGRIVRSYNMEGRSDENIEVPVDRSASGWVILNKIPRYCGTREEIVNMLESHPSQRLLWNKMQMLITLPILRNDKCIAVLNVDSDISYGPSVEDPGIKRIVNELFEYAQCFPYETGCF